MKRFKLFFLLVLLITNASFATHVNKSKKSDFIVKREKSLKYLYAHTNFKLQKSIIRQLSEQDNAVKGCHTFEIMMHKYKIMDLPELRSLIKDPIFKSLEREALKNNECGGQASAFIVDVYALLGFDKKGEEIYQRLLNLAAKNNFSAIRYLCINGNALPNINDAIGYCRYVLNSNNPNNNEDTRGVAFSVLADLYSKTKQATKLITLCEQNIYEPSDTFDTMTSKNECYLDMWMLAETFYSDKNYNQALNLFKRVTLSGYGPTGVSLQSTIADMYLSGKGVKANCNEAIVWYKKALKKNPNDPTTWNNLGVAYSNLSDYVLAFQCYQRAAKMGLARSQLNLANMYAAGLGTIQDNIQAYAWLSVAAAQGFKDINARVLENSRNNLAMKLTLLDKTGKDLRKAKYLAKTYYKKYVLRKQQ